MNLKCYLILLHWVPLPDPGPPKMKMTKGLFFMNNGFNQFNKIQVTIESGILTKKRKYRIVKDFLNLNGTLRQKCYINYRYYQMQKTQNKQNHMKKRYLCYVNGPIFFTAPHSKKLMRGGPQYNQKKRLHLRQLYTSYIAVKLAALTGKQSFCVWGKSSSLNEEELDPNYLLPQMFHKNPFHQSLHYWAIKNAGKPILHVDVHGKFNRKDNCELDVGMVSLQVHWGQDKLINAMKSFFEKQISKVFEGYNFLGFQCKINTDPALHGYWGGDMCTMTEQAAQLNIPTFQLQIPRAVRQKLFKDDKLMQNFAKGIKRLYDDIIVPWQKSRQLKVNKKIAEIFKPTITDEKEKEQCLDQVVIFEKKEQSNLNLKYV